MEKVLIEVCCGSYEDALAAQQTGAHRIELNSSMFLGGITPSFGTFLASRSALSIPIIVMIRPREAGFDYSPHEVDVMRRDARIFLENGADGIVFGFLHADGTFNLELMREFAALAHEFGKTAVCHRAFDVVPRPFEALEALIDAKIDRILTSGQAPVAPDGAELIRDLIKKSARRIEILPGAGLNEYNILRFIEFTGTDQVHYAAMTSRAETSTRCNAAIYFGGALFPREDIIPVADTGAMRAINGAVGKK